MAQDPSDLRQRHLGADKSSCVRMPKVVKPEIRQSSLSLCLIE